MFGHSSVRLSLQTKGGFYMSVIQTRGLSKRYKDRWAVNRLELVVEQGDIYGFIG